MRHADPLEVHPIRADGRTSVLLARFRAGWVRHRPVRCTAAEEFIVLDGTIEVNGSVLGPGSVAHVPAGAARTTTTSVEGCTAMAWFVGHLRWEDVEDPSAPGRPDPGRSNPEPLLAWHPGEGDGVEWATPLATWSVLVGEIDEPAPAHGDTVDLDPSVWATLPDAPHASRPPGRRLLRRTPRDG